MAPETRIMPWLTGLYPLFTNICGYVGSVPNPVVDGVDGARRAGDNSRPRVELDPWSLG